MDSLGIVPDGAVLSVLLTFQPGTLTSSSLDLLAATASPPVPTTPLAGQADPRCTPSNTAASLSSLGPFNPAGAVPTEVVKQILELEFVEMAELATDAGGMTVMHQTHPAPCDAQYAKPQ